ncbi:hypothetical protein V8C35DRAFT_328292 [Trichoderma chlorosporum]
MAQNARAAESMPTIRFTNLADLLNAMYAAPGDALRVTGVSPSVFKVLDEGYEENKIRLSMYTEDTQCLIITITTGPHEVSHLELNQELNAQINGMGLRYNWQNYGSKTFFFERRSPGGGGGGGKQTDSCGKPVPERRGGYPTIIIESGYSQTLPAVRDKIRSWFRDSNHQIKIVIFAKLYPTERRILIERWEERPQGGPLEGSLTPDCCQAVNITETSKTPPVYQVTGNDDLVLDFRLLFLRDPRQGEGDVIITAAWLQRYARRVWDVYDEEMQ